MKQKLTTLLIGIMLCVGQASADEGMWLLSLLEKLNYTQMQEMGLELSPEQIYSINNSSLKDAIVIFDNGCTGEIVSSQGLLFTNHHCGYDQIQNHSTLEHDYLSDGFWANDFKDELPNEGLTATFLIRMEEVTDKVTQQFTPVMSFQEKEKAFEEIKAEIEASAIDGTHYTANIKSFFDDNRYFLFVYETYSDVRLVGTPPSSIGKYGGDTDNWMWPRHTGDFCVFRVYAGPDGQPSEYSEENIPLKPRQHLKTSIAGVKKDDFTMVMGYPGGTDRYMSSWGVQELIDITNPNRIKIRGIRQDILLEEMRANKEIEIMYASKYSRSSNYWKYSIGQNKGFKRLKVVENKQELEARFAKWFEENDKKEYNNVLSDIEQYYTNRKSIAHHKQYLSEVFYRGIEVFGLAARFGEFLEMAASGQVEQDMYNTIVEEQTPYIEGVFSELSLSLDKKVAKALIQLYMGEVPVSEQPDIFNTIRKKYKGNIDKYVDRLYSKSIFASKEKLLEVLHNPTSKISKDPIYTLARGVNSKYEQLSEMDAEATAKFNEARSLYTKGLLEMDSSKTFYPDANFTMRLTYGTVGDYTPADAVHYSYYTTLKGVIEKWDPGNPEFEVPEKLIELYKQKDYGRYAADAYMPVCFTSNNDITGGNSGSPVLNGKGELVGLAFDGNWEAMSGDIIFEDELQKCICVDIRYVLFIIDKFAGATRLIEELSIVE